ncbi:MAG: ParB/RepB/Spo0J family partition protein, partial [Planctomycetes bacterium]|nr:ParB/RepB/Spo0J family partition protein [Planctomycetota bacterium]
MANGLGRGLNSLIPSRSAGGAVNKINANVTGSPFNNDRILEVAVDKINVNPLQPRQKFADQNMEELVESIREYGIIQPLIVSQKNGIYELIAGERRLRAAKTLGLKTVRAILRNANEQEKLEVALIENIQRENLNAIELASAYQKLIDDFNLTQDKVAKRVGKSRPAVTNTLRLLSLPEEIKLALIDGRISEG